MSVATLPLTLWRTFSRGRREQRTWRDFIDTFVRDPEVVRDKRKVAGFSLGTFDGNRRALPRVEQVHALTLDFDQGDTTIENAERLFPKTKSVIYTTFSHTPEHPKLRVILPFERAVNAEEYARIWDWAAAQITKAGHVLDESARDASRFWYLPSHAPKAPYEWRELEGDEFDVGRALKAVAGLKTHLSRPFQRAGAAAGLPATRKGRGAVDPFDATETFFGRAFVHADLAFEHQLLDNGALPVICPWASSHTSGEDGDSSTVIFPATTETGLGLFHCSHAHCVRRETLDLLDVLPLDALAKARREQDVGLVRAKIRAGWVEHLDALPGFPALDRLILRCYPDGSAPVVWTVKIGSRAHVDGLGSLPIESLLKQHVDLALRERRVIWGRLARPSKEGSG